MSAAHTSGPWTVGRELSSERPGSIPIEAASRESLGGKMHVAFVNGKAGEQEANARLIAAAPALLAATERAAHMFQVMAETVGITPQGKRVLGEIQSALRLARGA